ncbi:MATE family efflux transporter [Clostridia bacterium]|nr:MATE family efflux transporter [Clostridia bacterium]
MDRAKSAPLTMFSPPDLRRLIIPLIIEQALSLSVGMFDAIMVSSAGNAAIGGVSLIDQISILLINLFAALATGGAIVAGQYLGAKEKDGAANAGRHLMIVVFALSVVITGACLLLNSQIISVFGKLEKPVTDSAQVYFYITTCSFPFIAMFNASAALFRCMGNSKITMINAGIMNLVNLTGNSIFIYGFKWGAFGAGLATLIARTAAAVIMVILLRNPNRLISVRSYSLRGFDFNVVKRILQIGIPSGFENSFFQLGRILLTGLAASFGTAAMAANGVANGLAGMEVIPGSAIGLALTTIVSRCIGAGEREQAARYTKKLLKYAYIFHAGLNILLILLLPAILSLYGLPEETTNIAYACALAHGIGAMILWPLSFVLPNCFRAASDVRFPMSVSIFSMLVFRIGAAYLLAATTNLGALCVWLAMQIDWIFRSIMFIIRFLNGKWKNKV